MDPLNLKRLRSDRKRRLFACACVRELWKQLNDRRSRHGVEVAERYADGLATRDEVDAASSGALAARGAASVGKGATAHTRDAAWDAAWAAWDTTASVAWDTARADWAATRASRAAAKYAAQASSRGGLPFGWATARDAAHHRKVLLLDDIAGPDPLPTLHSGWLTWSEGTVPRVAQAIYQERAFDRLPVLADALEEAGCADADILGHLRGPGPHALGCWVVDLLTAKR
jgi:hypothetical protein